VHLVDPVFADPSSHSSLELLIAAYGYAVQIYCDFSAYTDMAIGLAGLLGFRFPRNFDQPYRAPSFRISGAAGTSACRAGCATISTSARLAARVRRCGAPASRCSARWCWAAVARGELEFRDLGRAARRRAGGRTAVAAGAARRLARAARWLGW
jgi:hypothetical protein